MDRKLTFRGPLFITGMPRSGTKLLRGLLNNHPLVAIPKQESHFLPMFLRKYGLDFDLEDDSKLRQVYESFIFTSYYQANKPLFGPVSYDDFQRGLSGRSWAAVFEYLLRRYAPKNAGADFIFGDKTPGYMLEVDMLKQVFPEARFIHIIRDPRDQVLSVNKAWGKSIFTAARRWRNSMAYLEGKHYPADWFFEIKFEDLLKDPGTTLKQICTFVGLDYDQSMQQLEEPTEAHGHAKGETVIVRNNHSRFKTRLRGRKLRRIEQLVYDEAIQLGYEMVKAKRYRPLSKAEYVILKLNDGISSALFHIRHKGLIKGFSYFIRLKMESSWRLQDRSKEEITQAYTASSQREQSAERKNQEATAS